MQNQYTQHIEEHWSQSKIDILIFIFSFLNMPLGQMHSLNLGYDFIIKHSMQAFNFLVCLI